MLYESKYQIEDQVKSTLNESKTGHIKCIIEKSSNDSTKYSYLVLSNDNKYFIESEKFIKLIKKVSPEDDSDLVKKVRSIAESCGYKSDIKVGDIVKFRNGLPIGEYAVSSIIEMEYGEELHRYELIPINYGNLSTDESYICGRLLLEFQYHDANWEKYFTEGTRQNNLPAWQGEVYNYSHIPDSEIDDPIYNDYTLPPIYMKHIIEKHSIRKRILEILRNEDFKLSIAEEMPCPVNELYIIRKSIMTKIEVLNGVGNIEKIPRDNHGHRKVEFTDKEQKLISLIGYYDKYKHKDENDKTGESKDHYPPDMTDYDIMKAIKEAYETAEKIEKRSYGRRANISEGVILYQGTSKDGLVIQFYYNFDDNHIHTAYPVFVDTTNRPDLKHPEDKNKKRQN